MILDLFAVTGKVAVVTGAGRGIGAATAIGLAQAGADVVISARTDSDLEKVAGQVQAAGQRAVAVPADLSDLDAVAGLAAVAHKEFGRLDIVINNVGGAYPRPFMETTVDFLEEALRFNVGTAHALTKAAVPVMLEHGGGSMVNISSVMGRISGRGFLAYGTAKAALAHFTELAAFDLAPRIRVNAIAVGAVATSALDIVLTSEEIRARMEAATPLRRIGTPRRSRPRCCSWCRTRAGSSPARCWRSTAAPRRPRSIWDYRTFDKHSGAERHDERAGAGQRMVYRVVQWSTGNVGRHAIAGIDARPDLSPAGVWVSTSDKVGRDAGELAGLGRRLGVPATNDWSTRSRPWSPRSRACSPRWTCR